MREALIVTALALGGAGCTTGMSVSVTAPSAEPPSTSTAGVDPSVPPPVPTTTAPTTTPTTARPSSTTTEAPPVPIRLGFAGDVNMIDGVEAQRPLDAVAELLSDPDVMMVNLETVIADPEDVGPPPIPKEFVFRSPPETLDQLAEAGVDVVSLANNHSWDYGPIGVVATDAHIEASDLLGAGVGPSTGASYEPVFLDVADRRVGVASLTLVPCDWARDPEASRPEIAYACGRFDSPTSAALTTLIERSDVAVVLLHGSEELADCPTAVIRKVVTRWLSLGVDVIAVSHPHVLGGVERKGDGVVLWSTGNFAFPNAGGRTGRSAVFEVVVGFEGVTEVVVHPTVLTGAVAAPASAEQAQSVRDEVSARSPGGSVAASGRLIPDAAPSICDSR